MGWHKLDSDYTELSDRNGGPRFGFVRGLRESKCRHLAMGRHKLDSGYTKTQVTPNSPTDIVTD